MIRHRTYNIYIYIATSQMFANSTVPNIILSIKQGEKEAHIIFHFRYGSGDRG